MDIDLDELRSFLMAANRAGYAEEQVDVVDEADGSHTITFASDAWKFHDNFFGGEPYGGREVISVKDRPVWMMTYYGRVSDTDLSNNVVYRFLRKALMLVAEEMPYRGPATFSEGDLEYRNTCRGDLIDFSGEESILEDGRKIYMALYAGGVVDRRPGD